MRRKRGAPDFVLFAIVLALLSVGIIMVFSSSAVAAAQTIGDPFYYLKRQLFWAFLGLVGMVIVVNIDYANYRGYVDWFLLGSIILLALVPLIGLESKGATRSLGIGSLSFQPAELAKLALILYLARNYSRNLARTHSFTKGIMPTIIVLGIICGLIMLQPDLGTAVTLAGSTFIILIAAGARLLHLGLLAVAGAAVVAAAIILAPYRMKRFLAFLDPWADPLGDGFQVIQSLLALGSGGLFGLGLGASKQKLFYLPERHTDFIYAIIGEELGFVGALAVLLLFFGFVWRGYKIAINARDSFGSLVAVGITSMIALQAVINLGVVTGSLPVTGITLPFISYGGSSLLFTLIGVGILLNISRYTNI